MYMYVPELSPAHNSYLIHNTAGIMVKDGCIGLPCMDVNHIVKLLLFTCFGTRVPGTL